MKAPPGTELFGGRQLRVALPVLCQNLMHVTHSLSWWAPSQYTPCVAAAVLGSGVAGADEQRVAQVIGSIADRVCDQFVNPYTFPSLHQRILEPYNYYNFGQVRHLYMCSLPSKIGKSLHIIRRYCGFTKIYAP